jgi:hypothetical protein
VSLPSSCAVCVFHVAKQCRRHAPGPGIDPLERAAWPHTLDAQRCGEGADDGKIVRCEQCIHWLQPDGKPLAPPAFSTVGYWSSQGATGDNEWWGHAGYCTRWAPSPGSGRPPHVEWRVTYRSDCCGDGQSMPVVIADESAD